MNKIALCASVASLIFAASTEAALPVYDAANEFSISNGNPNGVWSYGSLPTVGGAFSVFTESLTIVGLTSWRRNEAGSGAPGFYFNPSVNTFSDGQTTLLSGQLMCAPGTTNLCTLRFVVPETARYEIASSFIGLISNAAKPAGTTTDAFVAKDGASISPTLAIRGNGAASERGFATTLDLTLGATLDFAVSGASDGFASDSTGMHVRIAVVPVPEPETSAMFFAGLGMVASLTYRRKLKARRTALRSLQN